MRRFAALPSNARKAQRGLTLIELLLAIVVIGGLTILVTVGAYKSGRNLTAQAQAGAAVAFGQAIENAWAASPDYSTPLLSAASAAPYAPIAFQGPNGALNSLYGSIVPGPSNLTSAATNQTRPPPSFALQFSGIPRELCPVFANSAAGAYDNVVINSNSTYAKAVGGQYDAGIAVGECNQASNIVTLIRIKSYPLRTSGFCLVPTAAAPNPYSPASLTDAMWVWTGTNSFKNTMDGTTYYTNPPLYTRLYAPDGTLIC